MQYIMSAPEYIEDKWFIACTVTDNLSDTISKVIDTYHVYLEELPQDTDRDIIIAKALLEVQKI